ncbi:hypothetical protein Tco_0748876 [Tanacetum coccineum]|uniref:Reverse transcriptase Ty1/copia-type domain-containing protein n=1 Tax=Tanacetum coccineum TaxID=301880 RepID=A0ABQ4YX57_9ASTR
MKTPMSSDTKLTKDEECESVDSIKYRDMIGSLLYLTARNARYHVLGTMHLEVMKQTALAISITEAEYVSAEKACQQALWMKQALSDYDGACVFTDKWSLDKLAYGVPTNGPYQTNPPSPDDIMLSIRIDRECQVCRIRHEEEIDVL